MNILQYAPIEYYFQVILFSLSIVMMIKCVWGRKWEQLGVWFLIFGFTLIGIGCSRVLNVAGTVPTTLHY